MNNNQNQNNEIPDLMDTDLFKFLNKYKFYIIPVLILGLFLYNSFYKVDASEEAVILRLGKYHDTTSPGLHFKFPVIDEVFKVKVKTAFEEEFGFASFNEDIDSYGSDGLISLMMTNDPSIMEVIWTVQYRITDPKAYLFNVMDVENTIRDVSEAAMRRQIGDNNFEQILDNRDQLTLEEDVHEFMQKILGPGDDNYDTGITITQVKITSAKYPNEVAAAFDEVFKAQKDRDIAIKNAEAQRIEAENKAKGEVAVFDSLVAAYRAYGDITKKVMALDAQERIFQKVKDKTIIDSKLDGILQHLDIGKK